MKHVLINKAKTYILLIKVLRDLNILVGRLKNTYFTKGFYLYIGSAKRGLKARIRRHLAKKKKLFWHIDYLLFVNATTIRQVWITDHDKECVMAGLLGKKGYRVIDRFGSSDCNCRGHLFFVHRGVRQVQNLLKKEGFIKYADKNYRSRFN
jgi:sugar fermentation stimulation protein A